METEHAQQAAIEALLEEARTFPPPEEFRAQAIVQDDAVYRRAEEDFEGFWAELARSSSAGSRSRRGARTGHRRTAPGSRTAS